MQLVLVRVGGAVWLTLMSVATTARLQRDVGRRPADETLTSTLG